MSRYLTALVFAASMSIVLGHTGLVHAQQPTIIEKIEITFHTTNDDKDNDTKLQVYVVQGHDPKGNGKEIAGDDNIAYGTTFPDWKDNGPFLLPIKAEKATKEDLKNFTLKIRIIPNGRDTWRFHYTLRLYWSDGTNAVIQDGVSTRNGLELNQDTREGLYRHSIKG
jgi:hypothetical protein